MVSRNSLYLFPVLLVASALLMPVAVAHAAQPYAGQHKRAIKALSQKDVNDLRSGAGMGFAKAAELNHYPGPAHVMEHFDRLAFNAEQRRKTRKLYEKMKFQAVNVGREIIEKEARLDHLFASGKIDKSMLHETTEQISYLNGRLRYIHLQTHLDMKQLMTKHQVAIYDALRGYDGTEDHKSSHSGHH